MNINKGSLAKANDAHDNYDTVPEGYSGTVYTCSMHPEVRSTEEGSCPKCGMFLTPEGEAAEHGHHGHADHDHSCHDHSNLGHAHGAGKADAKGGEYDTVPDGYNGTIYTCPMHAQVRHPGPGSCPICGMGLEPETISLEEDGPNPELVDFTRRMWVGVALTIPLLIITMPIYLGYPQIREFFGEQTSLWIEVLLSTPVILWSGWPFYTRGYNSFRTMNLNMFSLIGMGVGAAYVLSLIHI